MDSESTRVQPIRCEGWTRHGGAFTLGPVKWTQCENNAVVELTVEQKGEVKTFPACIKCWNEGISTGIKIIEATPIVITYLVGSEGVE